MGKRKRKRAELPLFDLPLQPVTGESPLSGESPPPGESPPVDESPADEAPSIDETGPAVTREPSVIHQEDAADSGEEQLDLVELAGPATGGGPAAGGEPGSSELEAEEADDRALLGDRLLGGLADLAVQLVASGLALAAVHSLGIAVSWSDWMPFGVLALAFSFLYWVVPLAFWGRTPGMAWVGHSARAGSGEPLTVGQTFRRWLGALLTLAFAGLPLLLALTGRSFSDRISDSYTVAEP